jgi:hypothetical protein
MIFCGQCGLQLAPGTTRCPRCGATIDEPGTPEHGMDIHPDDATIASHALQLNTHNPVSPSPVPPPQPLVLRPGNENSDYGAPASHDATSRMDASAYGTQFSSHPHQPYSSGNSYAGQGSYPELATRGSGNTFGGTNYPMSIHVGYQPPFPSGQPSTTSKVRTTAVVFIILGVFFFLIATVLFVLQHSNVITSAPQNTTPIMATIHHLTQSFASIGNSY